MLPFDFIKATPVKIVKNKRISELTRSLAAKSVREKAVATKSGKEVKLKGVGVAALTVVNVLKKISMKPARIETRNKCFSFER